MIKDSLSKDHDPKGMDKKIHTGHPGKNAHDKSPLWKVKTLTCSGVIKDSLSKDHPKNMDKKIHTGHPGKNAHDKSPLWKAETLTCSGVIKDSLSKDHDPKGMDK